MDTPTITEKDLGSQAGRVFLITGGYSGIGFELARMLFDLGGTVWIAGRSPDKAKAAAERIEGSSGRMPHSTQAPGSIQFLHLDLADLGAIRQSAQYLLQHVERLDVVWHNAGVMVPPDETPLTPQGHDIQLSTNALGPFLLQHFLTPLMLSTAARQDVDRASVRVVWLTSNAHSAAPKPDGVDWDNINMKDDGSFTGRLKRYGQSKAMNVMYAHELARLYGPKGLISLSVHPGSLSSGLQKNLPWLVNMVFSMKRKHPKYGAYTMLFAGFSGLGQGKNGSYVAPHGKWSECDEFIAQGLDERATGERLWKVSEDIVKDFF